MAPLRFAVPNVRAICSLVRNFATRLRRFLVGVDLSLDPTFWTLTWGFSCYVSPKPCLLLIGLHDLVDKGGGHA